MPPVNGDTTCFRASIFIPSEQANSHVGTTLVSGRGLTVDFNAIPKIVVNEIMFERETRFIWTK